MIARVVAWVFLLAWPISIGIIVAQAERLRDLRFTNKVLRQDSEYLISRAERNEKKALDRERETRAELIHMSVLLNEASSKPAQVIEIDPSPMIEKLGEAIKNVAWGPGNNQSSEPGMNIIPDRIPDPSNIPTWHPEAENDPWVNTEPELDSMEDSNV